MESNRRTFLASAVVTAVAGCTTDAGSTGDPTETKTEPETTTEAEPETTTSATETTSPTSTPSFRLRVRSVAEEDVTVTLRLLRLSDDEVVYEETRTVSPNETLDFDGEFEPGVDYWFVMEHDSERAFESHIYDYEGIEVTIRSPSDVAVTEHEEV